MKRIVIAPYLYSKELIKKYRKEDPFTNVKFFTKESFLSNYYYQYGDEALIYLTSKFNKDYDISKQMLDVISKMSIENDSSDKFKEIISIKKELLSKGLLTKNEYFEQELLDSEIDVYFYSKNDIELNKFLNTKNVKYIESEGIFPSTVELFQSNNEELSYVFNKIASLLEQGVNPNKIAIYGLLDTDELIYSRLLKNYKFHINNAFPKTLLSKVYVNRFIANILEIGVDLALKQEKELSSDDPTFVNFERLVKKYMDNNLSEVYQSEIYKSVFIKEKLESEIYKDGIEVIKDPICPLDGYLFIINMVQGKYPILKSDNGYFSDKEKKLLGIVTSEEENADNYELFINFLKQKGTIYLSHSTCSFSEKYYPSPLIKSLNIKEVSEHDVSSYYSFDEAQLSYANELDLERNYLKSSNLLKKFRNTKDIAISYRTYDFRPKDIKHFTFDKVVELSYTSATAYYQCAFKYYLNYVLKIDELEDSFSLSLGNLAHDILENIPSGKSFDELYENAYNKLQDKFASNDWVFLRRIKEDLRRIFDYINNFEMQVADASFKREYQMKAYLDEHTLLKGRIDKLIVSDSKKLAGVVDYKTGNAKFEEPLTEYGLNLQLPTYSLLLKRSEQYQDYKVSGLFIQPLLLKSSDIFYSRILDNDLNKNSKLNGIISSSEGILEYFDSTIKEDEPKYLASIKFKKDGTLTTASLNKLKSDEYFEDVALIAEQLYLEASKLILNNRFEINPKMVNGDDASCKYCPFRDICYKDESCYIQINTKKNEEEGETASELN